MCLQQTQKCQKVSRTKTYHETKRSSVFALEKYPEFKEVIQYMHFVELRDLSPEAIENS